MLPDQRRLCQERSGKDKLQREAAKDSKSKVSSSAAQHASLNSPTERAEDHTNVVQSGTTPVASWPNEKERAPYDESHPPNITAPCNVGYVLGSFVTSRVKTGKITPSHCLSGFGAW